MTDSKDAKQTIIDTLRKDTSEVWSLATVTQDGTPWVRYVRGTVDEDLVLRCPTFAGTKKVAHIESNPAVHVTCGDTDSSKPGTYLQIEGTAEITTQPLDREAAWSDRLAKWFSGPADPNYAVVKITPSRITLCPIGQSGGIEVWKP